MFHVEQVTPKDHAKAVRLLQAQFDEHQISLSAESVDRAVARLIEMPERGVLLLALESGVPVGLAAIAYTWTLEHGGLVAWLAEHYVVTERLGRVWGTAWLVAVRKVASEAGGAAIELEVDATYRLAENLYRRAGFEPLRR